VDLDHPELAPLLVPGFDMVDLGPNPTPNPGWRFEGDFAGRDPIPEDEVGHGTHVAGTIAAVSNNAVGVAGVGWETRIMPIKALTRVVRISDGRVSGTGSSADVAAAIRYAADNGAHVINMSLGSPSSTSVEASAVAYAVSKGVVVVAAMGNDGSSSPSFPAAYPDVIAVAAIQSNESRAAFSQTGPHIDISGPGVGILSTYLAGGLATLSGTSMATPHVAGVAALVKAVKPSLTSAEVGDILRSTAKPLRDVASDPVPNDRYGWGLVDASAAVLKARGPIVLKPTITVKLRTPVVACLPKTISLPECGTIKTVIPLQCKVIKSVQIACPVTPTITKKTTTIVTGPGPQPGGADPFGVEQGGYEAGFAAGYAAAIEELQSGGGDAYGEGLFDE
jgi:subtilisin family serine protease